MNKPAPVDGCCWAWMTMAAWICGCWSIPVSAAPAGLADRAASAVQRDFRIFDYFRDTQKPKALIHGAVAYYLQHPVPIRGMTLTTFEPSGETNLFAVAETCWIDRTNRVATSPDPVSSQFSGGRFQVKGIGFQWQQAGLVLMISNEVQSVLRQDLFETRPASGKAASASAFRPVPSRTRSGDAPHSASEFVDQASPSLPIMNAPSLSVLQRPLTLLALAPWLAASGVAAPPSGTGFNNLLKKPAAPASPTHSAPAQHGSNPVKVAVESSTPAPSSSTNNPAKDRLPVIRPRGNVGIKSDSFIYQGDRKHLTYLGNVLVKDPDENPITTIECEWLSTVIPESRETLGEIVGLTNVVITFKGEKEEDRRFARGDRMVYNATNDTFILTGLPATVEYPSSGVSFVTESPIIYDRKTGSFSVTGQSKTLIRRNPFVKDEKSEPPANPAPSTPK